MWDKPKSLAMFVTCSSNFNPDVTNANKIISATNSPAASFAACICSLYVLFCIAATLAASAAFSKGLARSANPNFPNIPAVFDSVFFNFVSPFSNNLSCESKISSTSLLVFNLCSINSIRSSS